MYITEGVVLKKVVVGEVDLLYIIYTKDFGKIRALARGIRKEGAKLQGHLEVFSESLVSFVFGKNGEQVVGASLLNFWPNIRQDLNKVKTAQNLIELVDQNCLEGEKDEPLWKLLWKSFAFLEKNDLSEKELGLFENEFEKRLSGCLGYGSSTEGLKGVK